MPHDALVVIPARLDSTRLPGKLLLKIGEKSLLEHTWSRASRSGYPVIIATDSEEIEDEGRAIGAKVLRTGSCNNGTERCAAVLNLLERRPEFIVNWQGDSPLIPDDAPQGLLDHLTYYAKMQVATPVRKVGRLDGQACAVFNSEAKAIYFSRQPIPTNGPYWAHIGMYAYRSSALRQYGIIPSPLEQAEGLEQNRWIEAGVNIRCVAFARVDNCHEVNVPGDLELVAKELANASPRS